MTTPTFAYPYIEKQRVEMEHFSGPMENMVAGGEDDLLRRMVERVPLRYVKIYLEEMNLREAASAELKRSIRFLLARILQLRRLDEASAPAFISEACDKNNSDALCVCLFSLPNERLQAFAADSSRTLAQPKSARCLAIRFLQASGLALGGSEAQVTRDRLRKSLLEALASVTKIDISGYDGTEAASMKILQQCERWLESNKEKVTE